MFYRLAVFVLWVFLAKKDSNVQNIKEDNKMTKYEKNNYNFNKQKILYPIIILILIFMGGIKLIWSYNNLYSYDGLKHTTLTELKILKFLGVDFKKRDRFLGDTILMNACILNKNFEIVEFLLNAGININSKDRDGKTALTYAALYSDNPELVKFLIKKGAIVNDTHVESACMSTQNPEIIQVLLNNGAQRCKLSWAAFNNNINIVKFILNKGVEINELNDALITASANNNSLDVIKLFIEKGADVNSKNKNGDNALIVASRKWKKEFVKVLLEAGANINEKDKNGYSVIFNIVNKFDRELFELALQNNIDFDAKINPEEDTLLLYLVKNLRARPFNNYIGLYVGSKIDNKKTKKEIIYFIDMLLKKKFNYSAKDHKGMTTLDYLDEMSKLHDNDLYEEKRNIYWQLKDLVCFDEQGKERECNIQTQKQKQSHKNRK
ncbi:MAG: hypothetical protein E7019_06450 [Alphaproteobacteria bacterium]|nr:hypothetical protein [Alphaproteobacteria bacterium]